MPRNLLSIDDLSKGDITDLIGRADYLRKRSKRNKTPALKPQIGVLLFFESSTRTRLGFEVAAWRLGVKIVNINENKHTNLMIRSESVEDTIKSLDPYVDFFCIRHTEKEIFDKVLASTSKPVINCGNGYIEHPTQALADAFTIWTVYGRLDKLSVTLLGSLKYSRSAHSLIKLLSKYSGSTIKCCAPNKLQIDDQYQKSANTRNHLEYMTAPDWNSDIIYSAGLPYKSPTGIISKRTASQYRITKEIAENLKKGSIILNPLPRIDEIDKEVDLLPSAYYFKQNEWALFMRMAILERYCL